MSYLVLLLTLDGFPETLLSSSFCTSSLCPASPGLWWPWPPSPALSDPPPSSCRSPGSSTRTGCWPHEWTTALSFPWMGAPSARRTWWTSLSCLWWTRPRLSSTSAMPRCTKLVLRAPSDRRARGPPPAPRGPPQWAQLKRGSLSGQMGCREPVLLSSQVAPSLWGGWPLTGTCEQL